MVYMGSGWRSLILVPEGREGWGWSRFGSELSKVKAFYGSTVGSYAEMLGPPIGVSSLMGKKDGSGLGVDASHPGGERSFGVGVASSYVEVVSLAVTSLDKKLPIANEILGQRADFTLPMLDLDLVSMEVQSLVNCYDLEK